MKKYFVISTHDCTNDCMHVFIQIYVFIFILVYNPINVPQITIIAKHPANVAKAPRGIANPTQVYRNPEMHCADSILREFDALDCLRLWLKNLCNL